MAYASTLTLTLSNAREALNKQIAHFAEVESYPTSRTETTARFENNYGAIDIEAQSNSFTLSISSDSTSNLETLMEFIADYLVSHLPGMSAEQIVWKGYEPDSAQPANFREMTVTAKKVLGPGMIRLTLRGENLTSFARDGLHFRLLIPATAERAPIWPVKLSSGQLRFPEGKDMLHNRVYTIRNIRPESGEFDVDLVRHPGGVASDWAEKVATGAVVGILGPGGGYFPEGDWLLMGGDETALPAIARILENADPVTEGQVFIALRNPSHRLDFTHPEGVNITWLDDLGDTLPDAVEAVTPPSNRQAYAWFGGEQAHATRLRKYFKSTLGLPPKQQLSAAYWRRD